MKIRKLLLINLLILVIFFNLAIGVVFGQQIRIAHEMNPDLSDPTHACCATIKHFLELETDFEVEMFPGNVLGGAEAMFEQLQDNDIQIAVISVGGVSQFYNPISIYNMAFTYPDDFNIIQAIWDSEFTKKVFNEIEEKTGAKPMTILQRGGWAYLTNNKRPVRNLEDVKGLRIRGMDAGQLVTFEALGGIGIQMPFAEVYTSLEAGIIDGQRNPLSIIYNNSLQEVQGYLTLPGQTIGNGLLLVSSDWYNNLTERDQKIVKKICDYGKQTAIGVSLLSEIELVEELKKHMEFYYQTEQEFQEFREAALEKQIPWAKERWGEEFVEGYFEMVDNVVKEFENK